MESIASTAESQPEDSWEYEVLDEDEQDADVDTEQEYGSYVYVYDQQPDLNEVEVVEEGKVDYENKIDFENSITYEMNPGTVYSTVEYEEQSNQEDKVVEATPPPAPIKKYETIVYQVKKPVIDARSPCVGGNCSMKLKYEELLKEFNVLKLKENDYDNLILELDSLKTRNRSLEIELEELHASISRNPTVTNESDRAAEFIAEEYRRNSVTSHSDVKFKVRTIDIKLTNKMCRICLKNRKNNFDMHSEYHSSGIPFYVIYMKFTNLPIGKYDNKPTTICQYCLRLLELFYTFKLECKQSDSDLSTRLQIVQKSKGKSKRSQNAPYTSTSKSAQHKVQKRQYNAHKQQQAYEKNMFKEPKNKVIKLVKAYEEENSSGTVSKPKFRYTRKNEPPNTKPNSVTKSVHFSSSTKPDSAQANYVQNVNSTVSVHAGASSSVQQQQKKQINVVKNSSAVTTPRDSLPIYVEEVFGENNEVIKYMTVDFPQVSEDRITDSPVDNFEFIAMNVNVKEEVVVDDGEVA